MKLKLKFFINLLIATSISVPYTVVLGLPTELCVIILFGTSILFNLYDIMEWLDEHEFP